MRVLVFSFGFQFSLQSELSTTTPHDSVADVAVTPSVSATLNPASLLLCGVVALVADKNVGVVALLLVSPSLIPKQFHSKQFRCKIEIFKWRRRFSAVPGPRKTKVRI
jgi:hypothetical protein